MQLDVGNEPYLSQQKSPAYVYAIPCPSAVQSQYSEVCTSLHFKQTNKQTNGRYQVYYLPRFALDNNRQRCNCMTECVKSFKQHNRASSQPAKY